MAALAGWTEPRSYAPVEVAAARVGWAEPMSYGGTS